jgi:hypothetical protein
MRQRGAACLVEAREAEPDGDPDRLLDVVVLEPPPVGTDPVRLLEHDDEVRRVLDVRLPPVRTGAHGERRAIRPASGSRGFGAPPPRRPHGSSSLARDRRRVRTSTAADARLTAPSRQSRWRSRAAPTKPARARSDARYAGAAFRRESGGERVSCSLSGSRSCSSGTNRGSSGTREACAGIRYPSASGPFV